MHLRSGPWQAAFWQPVCYGFTLGEVPVVGIEEA